MAFVTSVPTNTVVVSTGCAPTSRAATQRRRAKSEVRVMAFVVGETGAV